MASYTVKLTPDMVNLASEGSLDTSVTDGVSIQRSVHMLTVVNGSTRKVITGVDDGDDIDDVIATIADLSFLV